MDSSPLDEGVSPVTTGRDEGMVGVGENEGRAGNATTECAVWRRGEEGTDSCLFAWDLQDHRANSRESLLPVLAGRLDGWCPEWRLTPADGRLMNIVPEQSPSCKWDGVAN